MSAHPGRFSFLFLPKFYIFGTYLLDSAHISGQGSITLWPILTTVFKQIHRQMPKRIKNRENRPVTFLRRKDNNGFRPGLPLTDCFGLLLEKGLPQRRPGFNHKRTEREKESGLFDSTSRRPALCGGRRTKIWLKIWLARKNPETCEARQMREIAGVLRHESRILECR